MQVVPKEVGTYNFQEEVENAPEVVVVLVSSNNCKVCMEFTNVFFQAFKTHSRFFKFCILDSDRSPVLAKDITDGYYPCTAVYDKGKLVMTFNGAPALEFYLGFLNRQISAANRRRFLEKQQQLPL